MLVWNKGFGVKCVLNTKKFLSRFETENWSGDTRKKEKM